MPYTAYDPGEDMIVFAAQASGESAYQCIDCKAAVEYVRAFERSLPDGGSTRVSPHFRYSNCAHGTVDTVSDNHGGGGGNRGGGGSESQLHKRRKRAALQEALERYPGADYGTEVYIGEKRADALLEFAEPHDEYGRGLAIEYQHKNEGKDIEATQAYFASHEYTTVWLWEDQFSFSSSVPDIDLFGGEVYTPWPDAVPEQESWQGLGLGQKKQQMWARAYETGLADSVVEASILKHWVVPTPYEYWMDEEIPWAARFRDEQCRSVREYRLQAAIPAVAASHPRRVCLPSELSDEIVYTASDWAALFETYPSEVFRRSAFLDGQSLEEAESLPLEVDFAPLLSRAFWQDAFLAGQTPTEESSTVLDRPYGPFDDVQCRACGHYQWAPDAGNCCPACGEPYDWAWNVDTGRIAADSAPHGIDL